jgi:tetraacyldisaccharide 4'-kinase
MRPSPAPGVAPDARKESGAILSAYYLALVSGLRLGLGPSLLRGGLWAASVPYGWATQIRNWAYDRGVRRPRRVPMPVVSVGNLTLGGTGKTPCVEYVARFYGTRGRRVAILSRGYGNRRGRNDEALVLADSLPDVPHLQGADRVRLARAAVEELQCEVIVLDDGFQHRRLARDLDVVLIDATEPWGHGHLFPRGLLREVRRGLRRAGVVVVTHADQIGRDERGRLREAIGRVAGGVPVAEARHRPLDLVNRARQYMPLAQLRGRPVAAFCGIGNPEAFRRTLADLGAAPQAFRVFPDHHRYSPTDVEELSRWAARLPADAFVITTLKDLVKLDAVSLGGRALWALRICLHFEAGREVFESKLQEVLRTEARASAA